MVERGAQNVLNIGEKKKMRRKRHEKRIEWHKI